MRVFLVGAGGAIGQPLVTQLVEQGHHVVATTRSADKATLLRSLGAEPVALDVLDRDATVAAVDAAKPDAVIHQATALSGSFDIKHFDRFFAQSNRLRTTGTDNVLAAARAAGVERVIAQSYAGWNLGVSGSMVKTEEDALDEEPPASARQSLAAILHVESVVPGADGLTGIVLRYGSFYGPGTSLGVGGEQVEMIRKRRFPVVGGGTGVWSFIHMHDAATATVAALDHGTAGIYNICDDDPAPVSEWMPYLAEAIGAKPPMRLPAWLAKPMLGEFGLLMMTRQRGCSNAKAKRELGWTPQFASWREGFRTGLG